MELTEDQKVFLDRVCYDRKNWKLNSDGKVDVDGNVNMTEMGLTEIPVKFGKVNGSFYCENNKLTNLKNCPDYISGVNFYCSLNQLIDYFKNIKEGDFKFWDKLDWYWILNEYPFLINIGLKYMAKVNRYYILRQFPHLKLYLE